MASMHCTTRTLLRDILRSQTTQTSLPPAFLIPSFTAQQRSSFSTTTSLSKRARKDGNTRRGMSPLKRTGFNKRFKISVDINNIPKPVLDPSLRTQVETDPNHGLWQFFDGDKSSLMTPESLNEYGRYWTVAELRRKDFDDLWKLWWVCTHEINRIKTYEAERERMKIGYGQREAEERLKEIASTKKSIKQVLTERWYAAESARQLAMTDPEIDLYADPSKGEQPYIPARLGSSYLEAPEDQPTDDLMSESQPIEQPTDGFMSESRPVEQPGEATTRQ